MSQLSLEKKQAATSKANPKKRVLSPEARARIAAAQRKRWAAQMKAAKWALKPEVRHVETSLMRQMAFAPGRSTDRWTLADFPVPISASSANRQGGASSRFRA